MNALSVCLLGFGEVGQVLADDLRTHVGRLSAWDLKFSDSASEPSRAAARQDVFAASDVKHAVEGADLVISAVTAAQIGEAAKSVAPHLKREAYFFDLNSTSPAAKCGAAGIVNSAGGRFVEAAIMSPISPRRMPSAHVAGWCACRGVLRRWRGTRLLGCGNVLREVRRCVRGQDVPQRDREGPRGSHARIIAHGAPP